jgi:hypothetical protein
MKRRSDLRAHARQPAAGAVEQRPGAARLDQNAPGLIAEDYAAVEPRAFGRVGDEGLGVGGLAAATSAAVIEWCSALATALQCATAMSCTHCNQTALLTWPSSSMCDGSAVKDLVKRFMGSHEDTKTRRCCAHGAAVLVHFSEWLHGQ